MKTPIWIWLQRMLPQRALCAFIYWISRCNIVWIKSPLISWFAKHYAIDLSEVAIPELRQYPNFNAFFTRSLKPDARSIDAGANVVVSPVDGRITEFGSISNGQLLQAKGFTYSVTELLCNTQQEPELFMRGQYATIYLAPHNYHRIHAPMSGKLTSMLYIAGKRFSVNGLTTTHIENLFCRNERLVCWMDAEIGAYAAVLVGALNVSSIATTITGEIPSGRDHAWPRIDAARFERGEVFATFNLGSTVILLFPEGSIAWNEDLQKGQTLRLGQRIADVTGQNA
jgi:phosphatidylserine decarboxylase